MTKAGDHCCARVVGDALLRVGGMKDGAKEDMKEGEREYMKVEEEELKS